MTTIESCALALWIIVALDIYDRWVTWKLRRVLRGKLKWVDVVDTNIADGYTVGTPDKIGGTE